MPNTEGTTLAVEVAVDTRYWVRRYTALAGIAFVIIDLVITLTVVIILAIDTRASDKQHAQVACRNTATLAHIEHVQVSQQAAQTAALAKAGFTFGIPKPRFDRLIEQSRIQQAAFLAALDRLAKSNCTTLR